MSEVEFDRLLDAVDAAIAPVPQDEMVQPPKAANDNDLVWGFIPFPEGWYAVF